MRNELRYKIESCLNRDITIEDLETWILSHLQNILDSSDDEIIEIANHIDADMVELSEEIISLEEYFDHLRSFLGQLETISVEIAPPASVEVLTGTSTAIAGVVITSEADPPGVVLDHYWSLVAA